DSSLVQKTGSPAVLVWARKGISAHQVDVVRNQHEFAFGEAGVDSARSVCQQECFCSGSSDETGTERDIVHRVPLVGVNAAFKHNDVQSVSLAKNALTAVPCQPGKRAVWDRDVVDAHGGGQ